MLYLPVFAFSLWAGPDVVVGGVSLMPLLVLLIGNSHLGATLLRVYERPEDRRAYWLFSFWATIPILAAAITGLWIPIVGSLLLTLYLTTVPWHFTGQNYGVALVFLRRRGIEVTPGLKRALWGSFFLSYLLWVVSLHAARPGMAEYAPVQSTGSVYGFLPIGVPLAWLPALGAVLGAAYLGCVVVAIVRMRRAAPLRELAPALLLMLTQFLWFAAPALAKALFRPDQLGPLAQIWAQGSAASTFLWVSLMHSLQYLWITDYYVRKERPGATSSGFLVKSLLAGMAILGFPLLFLSIDGVRAPSWDAGLYVMLGGAINVHHVLMDSVIWKLRHTRIADILIRGAPAEGAAAAPVEPRRRGWIAPVVWASGAVGVALYLAGTFETQLRLQPALQRDDRVTLESSLERLRWMGREDATARARLGYLLWREGDLDAALQQYERSAKKRPQAWVFVSMGRIHEASGDAAAALSAYERAIELDPSSVDALEGAERIRAVLARVGGRSR